MISNDHYEDYNDSNDDDDDIILQLVTHIVTIDEMLSIGLSLLYSQERIGRSKKETNIERFNDNYGMTPITFCKIYEDLQVTKTIRGCDNELKYHLMAMHFARNYPKMHQVEKDFDLSKGWVGGKIWDALRNIQSLKTIKIVWPDDLNVADVWIGTVDGTDSPANEPSHPEFSQDDGAFTHKHGRAGLKYELVISLTGGLIWMNGPFRGGENDVTIFRKHGLKDRLQALGKKVIGDRGYRGEKGLVSMINPLDSEGISRFKSRALHRHEAFNGKVKEFDALSNRFRHGSEKFKTMFEAVCVVCQYRTELETPLYDILIQDVLDRQ